MYCSVIPDQILQNIEQNDPANAAAARQALHTAELIRGQRFARFAQPLVPSTTRRSVYDAYHDSRLPGALVRDEGQPPIDDPVANVVYDSMDDFLKFYAEHFDRDGVDGRGRALWATIHFQRNYNNAFFQGDQLVWGDGDGIYFKTFAIDDVVSHEAQHFLTHSCIDMRYQFDSGAIDEGISDIAGVSVSMYRRNQTAAEGSYKVGQGLWTDRVNGDCLRNLAAPGTAFNDPVIGKDGCVAHVSQKHKDEVDHGRVHDHSTLISHAFYLVAQALGGYVWERATPLFLYPILSGKLRPSGSMRDFACLVGDATETDRERRAVSDSFQAVGILP